MEATNKTATNAGKPNDEKPDVERARRLRRRSLGRWAKRTALILLALGLIGMIALAWMPRPVPVETALVSRGKLTVTVDEDGRTRVKDRYLVSAPLSGNVARVELRPGDEVKQGQVLARLVPLSAPLLDERSRKEAQARVAAAQAAARQTRSQIERIKVGAEFAKKEAARERELVAKGASSQQTLDRLQMEQRAQEAELTSARFGVKVADHEVRMAQAALGRYGAGAKPKTEQLEVPSPINGRVLKLMQESEGVVQAGTPLLELGDPRALEIAVDVLTSDAVHISAKAPVSIERWGGEPLKAHVRLIEPSAFTRVSALGVEEQRVNAVIDLDEPYDKWSSLMDGYRVEARITTWSSESALRLPASAMFRHDGGWAVFVVEGDKAVLRKVEIGKNNGLEADVKSGVNVGERVIIHPSDKVADGVAVEVR